MKKQEGNKLIAEFMGLECDIMDGKLYDEDWNELMNVVKKIHEINTIGIAMHYEIKRQWDTVISFIQWYNITKL